MYLLFVIFVAGIYKLIKHELHYYLSVCLATGGYSFLIEVFNIAALIKNNKSLHFHYYFKN